MPTPSPGPRSASSEDGSVVWMLMLGSALIALVAAQTRKGMPEATATADPAFEPRPHQRVAPNGQAGARSHSGRSAQRVADTQPERGRAATDPTQITAAGWKDVAVRTFLEFNKDRVLSVAAGVTFYTLLSLFPAVAALVSCYGLFADVNVINDHLASLQGVLPSGAIEIIGEQVKRIAAKGGGTLGLTFFTSLVLSLWSANAAMKAMFDALNVVYEEQEKRSFVMLNLRSLTFTVGALVFTIFALGSIVVLPVVFNFIGISEGAWYVAALRWPALVVVLLGGLSLLYRYGPSRERARWRWVGVGSVVAGLLWLVASLLFSWYVSSFGNYNETYGSLGAVIGFMTWIWISSTIVLLGGEINAEIEHQTGQDTTTGPALPLGEREARMADTVGAAA
ncbi:YihY/virulence factor BrkB family protein [Methylobacterium sp. WL12]|uniref:YihY/virulence factor BrkB family protein n=1 Tax=Methylobacterium sp. WL12 TaxID=2603890 RepID=UPI0016506632|nr:YihY/virulence factor BrkB family protein [Methylobacterium sp. WL12]